MFVGTLTNIGNGFLIARVLGLSQLIIKSWIFIKKLINQAIIHVFHINVKSVNGLIFNCLLAYLMQYNMMHA